MKYIIEHLEPELFEWCIIEYRHITKIVGKKNVLFTHLNYKKDCDTLRGFARAEQKSFTSQTLGKVCVLDPNASQVLKPSDATQFDALVFGGILGNYPMEKRTKVKIPDNYERRNLGKEQMATDNAVYVAKEIVEKGKKLGDIPFKDHITVPLDEGEEVDFPFRYVLVNGKPLVSGDLITLLKKGRL